jgi:cytochrome c biogenesis protein CcmG/thiol:disulfide interchange protein DsbE
VTPTPGGPPEQAAPHVAGRGWPAALRSRRAAVTAAIAAVVIVGLAVAGATVGAGSDAPHTFGRAKNFSLGVLGQPGRRISLRSMTGRPVIVNFFASWCTPCRRETPLLARFYRDTGGRPAIIGVDVNDSSSAGLAFVHRSGVTYPVVADPAPMTAAIAYNLPGLPATFFLNARHVIVKRVYGPVTQAELNSGARLMAGKAG